MLPWLRLESLSNRMDGSNFNEQRAETKALDLLLGRKRAWVGVLELTSTRFQHIAAARPNPLPGFCSHLWEDLTPPGIHRSPFMFSLVWLPPLTNLSLHPVRPSSAPYSLRSVHTFLCPSGHLEEQSACCGSFPASHLFLTPSAIVASESSVTQVVPDFNSANMCAVFGFSSTLLWT